MRLIVLENKRRTLPIDSTSSYPWLSGNVGAMLTELCNCETEQRL